MTVEEFNMNQINEIYKPTVITYYILFNQEDGIVIDYGEVNPDCVLSTIWQIDRYTDREEWVNKLIELGIEVSS
jgi:hypothetical protein